ncbi:MAG: archaemetzincin family Zn-dependent metalloprotease [Desulfobacterales bacterium]
MISRPAYSILVAPIGEIEPALCELIRCRIEDIYGLRSEVQPILKDVDFAYNPERRQYHSTPILAQLAASAPVRALKLVAITQADLFIPILTHVYGEAQLGGKAAIISTYRLMNDNPAAGSDDSLQIRAAKEAIHELGHTFKLRHCPEHSCIMHYCRSIKDVDRKSNQLCRHCKVMLHDELKCLGLKEVP